MSVYPRGRIYWFKFRLNGKLHRGSTGLTNEDDAIEFEDQEKRKLRRRRAGLSTLPEHAPHIADFAETYYKHAVKTLKRPDRVEDLLFVVLRFFGRRPSDPDRQPRDGEEAPFHDLRLSDPIEHPQWILDFEDWMDRRGVAGQTRNQYRSTMTQLYALALSPLHRQQTGIVVNPFVGVFRDRSKGRTVTNTADELRAVLAAASYHVRIAIAIGLLAHKLRMANILGLRWSRDVDLGKRTARDGTIVWGWLTVHDHKTDGDGAPMVVAISEQLYTILVDAKRRARTDWVVEYRGRRLTKVRDGVRRACLRAGVTYGRFVDNGMTFHTLRHTSSTTLAELDVSEAKRKSAGGHKSIATEQKYTHLRPIHEVETVEQLSAAMPIADVVTQPHRRPKRVPTLQAASHMAAVSSTVHQQRSDAMNDTKLLADEYDRLHPAREGF